MIVISIVTALGLEHGAQAWYHRHAAQESSAKIDSEIRFNIRELKSSLDHNQATAAKGSGRGEPVRQLDET
jgi:hypothetical protein